jgi:hypothetical protein
MTPVKYRGLARSTSIRNRFTCLTTREQIQLEMLKKMVFMCLVKYNREINPNKKLRIKRSCLAIAFLSYSIRKDLYEPLERPIRHCMRLDDVTFYFAKEFLRFRREDLVGLYQLLRFPDRVILDNQGVMSGEEIFLRGLYELVTAHKKTSIAETFGRHPSDQSRAFSYFISHIYNNFKHLVIDNLDWWNENGLLEWSAVAIEEKLGVRFVKRICGFIDCNCLKTNRPGGGPYGALGPRSSTFLL